MTAAADPRFTMGWRRIVLRRLVAAEAAQQRWPRAPTGAEGRRRRWSR
jgi:hypothetical protein